MADADHWNAVTLDDLAMNASPVGLFTADGQTTNVALSGIDLGTATYSYDTCNANQDEMLADFIEGTGSSLMPGLLQFSDLPGGTWDVYVYTTAGSDGNLPGITSADSQFHLTIQRKEVLGSNEPPPFPVYVSNFESMVTPNGESIAGWVAGTHYVKFSNVLVPSGYATNVVMERYSDSESAPLVAGIQLVQTAADVSNDVDGDGFSDDIDACPVHFDTANNGETLDEGAGPDNPCENYGTCEALLTTPWTGTRAPAPFTPWLAPWGPTFACRTRSAPKSIWGTPANIIACACANPISPMMATAVKAKICSGGFITSLSVGENFACGTTDDYKLQCFGQNITNLQDDLASMPTDGYFQVACSDETCCAVRATGESTTVYDIECFTNRNNDNTLSNVEIMLPEGHLF